MATAPRENPSPTNETPPVVQERAAQQLQTNVELVQQDASIENTGVVPTNFDKIASEVEEAQNAGTFSLREATVLWMQEDPSTVAGITKGAVKLEMLS